MHANLKSWYCPDIEDLSTFSPPEFDNFSFLFRALVGLEGSEGAESFDIHVCTPKWLLSNLKKEDVVCGRHLLIVNEFNFERILNRIRDLIESCRGDDWDEIATKASRIGYWEFEDYKEDTSN